MQWIWLDGGCRPGGGWRVVRRRLENGHQEGPGIFILVIWNRHERRFVIGQSRHRMRSKACLQARARPITDAWKTSASH